VRVPGACLGKIPRRWWVGAGACPVGNLLSEDAFTFLKSCSPPSASVCGVRAAGAMAPSGCSSLSVLRADKSETTQWFLESSVKVTHDWRSVNLRPASEPGKAGLQGCPHIKQGHWPCPCTPSFHLSLPPSPLPMLGFGGGWMGRWMDILMDGWVFCHASGSKGSLAMRGMGSNPAHTPPWEFEDWGGLGVGPARDLAFSGFL